MLGIKKNLNTLFAGLKLFTKSYPLKPAKLLQGE